MNTRDMITGAGIGAAVVFMLDPNGGTARRARVRDQIVRASRKTRDALDTTARDMRNRAQGIIAVTRLRFASEEVGDETLIQRVRATLGRWCSHPRAITVDVRGGEVTLHGPVLAAEAERLAAAVAGVRGVTRVNNELEPHETGEGVPALQGNGRVPGTSLDILQNRWAPATRALVTTSLLATSVLIAAAYARRGARAM